MKRKSPSPTPVPAQTRARSLRDEIALQARKLWEGYGRPEGRDVAIWLEAEAQVLGADPNVNQQAGGAVASEQAGEARSGNTQRSRPDEPKLTTNTSS